MNTIETLSEEAYEEAETFHSLAFKLLGIDYLPLPIWNGFDDDVYLTDGDYQQIYNIVCQRLPGASNWWDATERQRMICMEDALQNDKRRDSMSCPEVAERLERLRSGGEAFTSQHKLARQIGCASSTINKAIRSTPLLKAWAKREVAAVPRVQSLNDVVTDRTQQGCEPDPADEAAIREHLERATAEERKFFANLSREYQLAFLNDPDKYWKMLERKP